jgi:FKBP-type peptidyl-prolyl cis-trans isomerase FklB
MRHHLHFIALACFALLLAGCGRSAWNSVTLRTGPLKDDCEQISYAFGMTIGADWKQAKVDFDWQAATRGMNDALNGSLSQTALTDAHKILAKYKMEQQSALSSDTSTGNNAQGQPRAAGPSTEERDQASYATGLNIGSTWKLMRLDLDVPSIARGISDFELGDDHLMALDEARKLVLQYGQEISARQLAERKALADKNRLEGETFLQQNRGKPGIVALPSGLQYKILREGSGNPPALENWVTVHFRGTLLDGTEIDNSNKYDQPCALGLNSIMAGWSEALQLMKPGAKWEIYVPSNLAYGSEGALSVGPNATLIYTFELLSVLPDRPQPTPEQIARENRD